MHRAQNTDLRYWARIILFFFSSFPMTPHDNLSLLGRGRRLSLLPAFELSRLSLTQVPMLLGGNCSLSVSPKGAKRAEETV